MQYVEIKILAAIPEADRHAGHKAIVATEAPVEAVIAALADAGLQAIEATRDIVRRSGPRAKAPPAA